MNDADQDYPLTLRGGVPLGVSEPTLAARGSGLPRPNSPVSRDNYSSAEQFIAEIKQTFREERDMGMVEGPFTITEAAEYCGCTPEELCPGPMAAIDEGDKVRTIYDGSWGGANAHIQQHTEECTTAPTARTGHRTAHPQGGRHQSPQTRQDPLSGLAIPSGPNW